MVLLSIGFASGKHDVYDRFNELAKFFRNKGISIGLVESDSKDMHFIKCIIKDEDINNENGPEIIESFNIYTSNIVYDIIMDSFQADAISRIINENYSYFKAEEIADIQNKSLNILNGRSEISGENYLYYIKRKERIVKKVFDYICENNEIILEGFFRFRLKDFDGEIEELVDKVVEEYLVEREYNEFIKLLKYFVEIQESRIDLVNIVVTVDGGYSMYDSGGNEITQDFMKDLLNENLSGEINYDDLLVSSLITAAPKYIIIHNMSNIRNKEIIEMINSVFCDRVRVCPGCSLCLDKSPIHKI